VQTRCKPTSRYSAAEDSTGRHERRSIPGSATLGGAERHQTTRAIANFKREGTEVRSTSSGGVWAPGGPPRLQSECAGEPAGGFDSRPLGRRESNDLVRRVANDYDGEIRGQGPRRYIASTCTNAPGRCRPFHPVQAGGTDPYGGPKIVHVARDLRGFSEVLHQVEETPGRVPSSSRWPCPWPSRCRPRGAIDPRRRSVRGRPRSQPWSEGPSCSPRCRTVRPQRPRCRVAHCSSFLQRRSASLSSFRVGGAR
jgi:hypothetical protein